MFNWVLFVFYVQIGIIVPVIVYEYLGKEYLMSGITAAGFFLVFVAFQFPRMLPPYFVAVGQ